MNRIQVLLIVGVLCLFQQFTIGQTIQNVHFLKTVGVLDSLYSETLKESRKIYIQLPSSYSPEKKQKYPVVYILDGEIFLPTVNNVLDYYSGGYMPEMVLVGISNNNNRTRDLTTSVIKSKYGVPFNEKNGEAEKFSQFIEKELIPYIEEKYNVSNFRTLIGHSYGGLFAIYTLINHPALFANYLAIDPSLDWDEQKLLNQAKEVLSIKNYQNKSLHISLSGQLHWQDSKITLDNVMRDTSDFTLFTRSNIEFSNIVKRNSENGLLFDWEFYPKELHGTVPFPSILNGLKAIFAWYTMENTDKINSFDTSKEELLNIIKHREKKLNDHFGYLEAPYPEELFNMSAYMKLDMQQYEKAKMYFELAIEYYPESAKAYGSMADYYEKIGDNNNATKLVTKAFEISGDDYYKERAEALTKKTKADKK